MNHISIDVPLPEIMDVVVFFTCLILIATAFKIKAAIKNFQPPPPLTHEALMASVKKGLDDAREKVAADLAKNLFDFTKEAHPWADKMAAIQAQSEKPRGEAIPPQAQREQAQAIHPWAAEAIKERAAIGSDRYEADPSKDKGGYMTPTFSGTGPNARPTHRPEFEAYVPSKDPVRIMEGKEDSQFP